MNASFNHLGGDNWWIHANITAAAPTVTVLKTIPASPGTGVNTSFPGSAGTALAYRLVITGYHIAANQTNASVVTVEIRSAGSNNLLWSDMVPATTGNWRSDNCNVWLPAVAGESIDCRTSGTLTGNVRITLWGKILPSTTPLADFYDGAAH